SCYRGWGSDVCSSDLALVALAAAPRFLLRAVEAAAGRRKVLVAIFQRGAVDGLSMVPPYGDVAYAAVRPGIAIQPPSHGESEREIGRAAGRGRGGARE